MDEAFKIAGIEIKPGERKCIELPAENLYTPINIPVHVIRGINPGPCIFVTAAIHGDEINGIEIIRQLLDSSAMKRIHGTLIAVPVVNMYGFISLSRYLPDRRDLNRSFPGSQKGSLASRLANTLMKEIVVHCSCGIDLHTGAINRPNLPQIRVNLDTEGSEKLGKAFNVPVVLDSKLRDGSLREAASNLDIPVLVYEGGEALRFDGLAARMGVRGIRRVMESLGMLNISSSRKRSSILPVISRSSLWIRAPKSGIFYPLKKLGDRVREGEILGSIVDPFGGAGEMAVKTGENSIIIGKNNLPFVNEGDALFHIACFDRIELVES
ncbi:MAG TPA: succinylglutamate desuccinylase/aspartoacylase family protein, partial [Methanosarcina sp.]|nr:succinylglutamate desuccinylase/aspartoacylase family protein [Methanosarcina sp.]